jgi:hypothetical protein
MRLAFTVTLIWSEDHTVASNVVLFGSDAVEIAARAKLLYPEHHVMAVVRAPWLDKRIEA